MYTVEQIASEIEQRKPDFTEFKEILKDDPHLLKSHIEQTSNFSEKLLKAELALITYETHYRYYPYGETVNYFSELILNNLSNAKIFQQGRHHSLGDYGIINSFKDFQIAYHITDIKPYLTKYLWDKVRAKSSSTKAAIKNIQPNLMSLRAFENYLKTIKKMPSTDALIYFTTLKDPSFNQLREQFVEAIFTKCKPSIKLQRSLNDSWILGTMSLSDQSSSTVTKHMVLDRMNLRNLANRLQIPVAESIFDERDSEYKPFITKVTRDVTPEPQQVSYLFNAALILECSNMLTHNPVHEYFSKCIMEHLQAPEYKEPLDKLTKTNVTYSKVLTKLGVNYGQV